MGALGVRVAASRDELNQFTHHLLKDLQALEKMLEMGWFETDPIRIGAEQEICLIDREGKPSPCNIAVLKRLKHPRFTTELARFNLEANLEPEIFTGHCFSQMEGKLKDLLGQLSACLTDMEADAVLTGILPTIGKFDLDKGNLTPIDRYYALIDAVNKSRGDSYELRIEGTDELNLRQASALIEACNTSFQVHLQVRPEQFVQQYNYAQAVAAPVLAVSVNSPMLFGKRLWHETRIALFQQSIDTRITGDHLRDTVPRVTFGTDWVRNSILDLYRQDAIRFKSLLIGDPEPDVFEQLAAGQTPKLTALNIHNSTVYRWMRPCYGVSPNGKPHLRIENRLFASGPTVVDEIANSAFWIGLMTGMSEVYPDITKVMDFGDARSNFTKAARAGLGSKFNWVNDQTVADTELIEKELLPIARQGLQQVGIATEDIDRYLGIIGERNQTGRTGARWIVESYSRLVKQTSREEATSALMASMRRQQQQGIPGHEWELANLAADWSPSALLVEEFMTTDLFTIEATDLPELAANICDWQKLRFLPVEDEHGKLNGLMTAGQLLRHFSRQNLDQYRQTRPIRDLMDPKPVTIAPDDTITEAINRMRRHKVGCLPVVAADGKLVGIITDYNFLSITTNLLKRFEARNRRRHSVIADNEPDAAEPNGAPTAEPESAQPSGQ